jgi:sugar phosphate isomerase/epimerase
MDIGINTNLWGSEQHGENLPSILAEIAEAGYDGLEIGVLRFETLDHPEVFLDMVNQNDLYVAGIHSIGRLYFDDNLDYVKEAADFTKAVESRYMMVSGDSNKEKTTDELKGQIEILNQAGEICQERGITYCYHNHSFEFAKGGEELRMICGLTDPELVSLCLDIGWVERSGESPLAVVQDYLHRIRYLHVKDTRDEKFVNLGEGTVDIPGVVDLLKGKTDVYFTVELDEIVPSSLESAKKCLAYLRELGL